MAGASGEHKRVHSNLLFRTRQQLPAACEAWGPDIRVQTTSELYTYPDLVVFCGEPKFGDQELDTLLNPLLIVEILSRSTEAYDRGMKFEQYRGIETLREYLMVSSDRIHVELFTKKGDGVWSFSEWNLAGDLVTLESCNCRLTVGEIYEKVEFTK